MIETSTGNVRLTMENLQQLAEVEGRLSNLQNEISLATKNLSVINKDVIKAVKEREYQQELITKFTDIATQKGIELESLKNSVAELSKQSENLNQEAILIKETHSKKEINLEERENTLKFKEEDQKKNEDDFKVGLLKLKEDRKSLDVVKSAFQEAVKLVTWK